MGETCTLVPVWYRDQDGDGFGDSKVMMKLCLPPTGYVATGGDCCDMDKQAFPGQTAYFTKSNGCGNYDYDCDTHETPQSDGPTDCVQAFLGCAFDTNHTTCNPTTSPPSDCGGVFEDHDPVQCGEIWSKNGVECQLSSGSCVAVHGGSPSGTQACR